jgi:transcriptional regulator with XRE-family HTH domain
VHIGPALAEARTEAGMTVEDVSDRTRIRRAIINDIEHDDYSSCGGDFYARGHIRAIAKVVGADPVPLIEEYDESVLARDNAELTTGPDPADWLQAEGRTDALLWRPPAAGPGPDTWAAPGASGPPNGSPPANGTPADGTLANGAGRAAAGRDTAPQPVIPGGPPGRPAGPTAVSALRDSTAGAGRAALAAVRRAADRIRQIRLEVPGGLAAQSGQPGDGQARGSVAELRRIGADAVQRLSRLRTAEQGPSRIIGGVAILLAALVLVLYGIFSGPAHSAPSPAHRPARSAHPSPAPQSPAHTSAAARPSVTALRPARVAAFGPGGVADGDNGQLAALALTGRGGGWRSNWYATPRFGGLQSGTGLLLDMGRTVTVSRATVRLGPAAGADVQLRAGPRPALGALRPVAAAMSGGGSVVLKPGGQARGRYLLIWFTRLPPDTAGTYQVTIDGLAITGSAAP